MIKKVWFFTPVRRVNRPGFRMSYPPAIKEYPLIGMGILHTMFENNGLLTMPHCVRPVRKLNAMIKRLCAPLTLANQLALVVLMLALLGLAGMAVSAWLIQGIQGSAHAINKAGSLRMQSYRLLAAVPLKKR